MTEEAKKEAIGNGSDDTTVNDTSDRDMETSGKDVGTSDTATETTDPQDEVIETPEKEETVRIVDETFRPKIKPVLDEKTKELLEKKRAKKVPEFKRQEWFRYKRLGDHWRRPKGLHSKMRVNKGYRPPRARVGFGTPAEVRGLHPSGFRDVLVYNAADLDNIDPEKEAVRIGRTVGRRKRLDIIEKADSMNIRVLNRRGL